MDVVVFSNKPSIERKIGAIRCCPIDARSYDALTKEHESLVYLDVSDMEDLEREVASGLRRKYVRLAIIDPKNQVTDVAKLFRRGVVDYVGRTLWNEENLVKRFRQISRNLSRSAGSAAPSRGNKVTPSDGWSELVSGKDYPFFFLYVGLDNRERLRALLPTSRYAALLNFDNYLRRYVIEANGKFWIWKDRFRGVILFPFHPNGERCVSCAFKIMLYRRFFDIEESLLKKPISFRMAMHLGVTAYHEEPEGKVLPYEAINTVFHLGDQFTEPGTFCLTEDVYDTLPQSLRPFFIETGFFENRTVYKMREYR